MAGKKTTVIMSGTTCTARVLENSPMIHYLLVMYYPLKCTDMSLRRDCRNCGEILYEDEREI